MNSTETISIVLASDNHYAVMIAALIKSIEIHHISNELLLFLIIDDGISNKNKEKIQNSIDTKKTTLQWIKSENILSKEVKLPTDRSTFPFTAYFRLYAPYLVASDCKKLIYMDVDMIVYDDISHLYNIDIGNNLVGAVQDYMLTAMNGIPNYKDLNIPPDAKYFNSGLLVINPQKWVTSNIINDVIDCLTINRKHVIYPDQYGLNIVLQNQWYELDRAWNCSPLFDFPPNPSLVHFLDIKPIFKSCFAQEKYKKDFFRLLSLTAFDDFKPISDYHRLLKKVLTKAKKIIK
jgi:lipopolysaccharide biosynthesis glycosyltransferase